MFTLRVRCGAALFSPQSLPAHLLPNIFLPFIAGFRFIGLPDAWELQYFGTTAYGPAQDNDQDGANNLMEWAFNLNPTRPDSAALTPGTGIAGLPVARLTGSAGNQRMTIEFIRRKNAALTYTVQFANSPAGASFQSTVNAPTVAPIDANWERVIVEDSVTTGDQAIRFGRVRVTAP